MLQPASFAVSGAMLSTAVGMRWKVPSSTVNCQPLTVALSGKMVIRPQFISANEQFVSAIVELSLPRKEICDTACHHHTVNASKLKNRDHLSSIATIYLFYQSLCDILLVVGDRLRACVELPPSGGV